MLDIGWSELLVIAVVAIIFVGPRDLIPMLRTFGQYAAKLKKMAGEFQSQFNDALREAELDEISKKVGDIRNLTPLNAMKDQFESEMRDIGKLTEGVRPGESDGMSGESQDGTRPLPAATQAGEGASPDKPPPAKKKKRAQAGSAARKAPAGKSSPGKRAPAKPAADKAPGRTRSGRNAAGTGKSGAAGDKA